MLSPINHKYNLLPWLLGLSLVTLAIFQGGYDFITVDTLYKIEISKMMLNGKMIYKDLFEVNHPMPTYIIWIAVYIASKFSWLNEVFATKALLCSLCLLSVVLSHKIMVLSDEYKDKYFRFIFITALFYVTFLLPMHFSGSAQLGQKSHLFFILFLPYLHSFLLTDTQRKQHPYLMLIIGLFAGIGLCVKIYFFVIAAILEISRMRSKQSFFSVFRIETFTIGFVAISFLLSIILFTPEYITEVIPIAKIAYSGYASRGSTEWLKFIIENSPNFIFLLLFVSIKSNTPKYSSLLKLAIVASVICIFSQASKWHYTAIPTLSLIMLFVATIISDIVRQTMENSSAEKDQKFNNSNLPNICLALVTVSFITLSLTSNISNYHSKKMKLYDTYHIDHLIDLSKEYGDKGGAFFLTTRMKAGIFTWIYGDFSLQSYFYSAYIIDGLDSYKKENQKKKSPLWIKENVETREDKVRNIIINDINRQKPALIIVQDDKTMNKKNTKTNVNYISFLSKNSKFQKTWQQYRFKEQIENNYTDSRVFSIYIRSDL